MHRIAVHHVVTVALTALPIAPAIALAQPTTTEIRHPDARYIDNSIVARVVRFADEKSGVPSQALRSISVRIGEEDGTDHVVLNRINAVVITRNGHVAILDELASAVRIFDSTDRFVQRFGQAGRGPGDFHFPRSMILGPADELVVHDQMGRLQVFTLQNGAYRLQRTIPMEFDVQSMCFLGRQLFAAGSTYDAFTFALHKVDFGTGKLTGSFGRFYDSPSFMTNVQANAGSLVCDAERDMVVLGTSAFIGEIRAWTSGGTALWRVSIADYKSNIAVSVGERRRVEVSPDGVTSLHALTLVPGVGLVANYGFRTRQQIMDKEALGTPSTLVVNPATGAATWLRTAWPVLGAVRGATVATVSEDPFPQIRMFTLSR